MSNEPFMFCKTCGYALGALPEPRCPECGQGFNPRDDQTFRAAEDLPLFRRRRASLLSLWFLGSIPVAGVAGFLAVLSGGAGHGSYFFAKLLFPFSMYWWACERGSITTAMLILGLAQFPVYALAIGGASRKGIRGIIVLAILLIHGVFVVGTLNQTAF